MPYNTRKLRPSLVRAIYTAIRKGRNRSGPRSTYSKVLIALEKMKISTGKAKKYLQLAEEDGLIVNLGNELAIPDVKAVKAVGERDPYCFECHKPNDLMYCSACFRTFHEKCRKSNPERGRNWPLELTKLPKDVIEFHLKCVVNYYIKNEDTLCTACILVELSNRRDPAIGKAEITKLLDPLFEDMKNWISQDTFSPMEGSISVGMPKEDLPVFQKLCFRYKMDLACIRKKLDRNSYQSLMDFYIDILCLQHNMGIMFGQEDEYISCEYLTLDAYYNLAEIRQCLRCYTNSRNSRPHWFSEPCVPPHKIMLVKQSGFGYWPAKVLHTKRDMCDVRFFGKGYPRAIVNVEHVVPLDSDLRKLHVKKSAKFKAAMKEVQMYMERIAENEQLAMVEHADDSVVLLHDKDKRKPTVRVAALRSRDPVASASTSQIVALENSSKSITSKSSTSPTEPISRKRPTTSLDDYTVAKFSRMLSVAQSMDEMREIATRAYDSDVGRLKVKISALTREIEDLHIKKEEESDECRSPPGNKYPLPAPIKF